MPKYNWKSCGWRTIAPLSIALLFLVFFDFRYEGPSAQLYHYIFFTQYSSQDGYVNCTNPLVPNYVHWIWIHNFPSKFTFSQFLSAVSVLHNLKPERIYFWHSTHPQGIWWGRFLDTVRNSSVNFYPNFIHPPTTIFENSVNMPEHQADIVKLQKLMEFGGIYLDFDVIVVKSFQPLQCYSATLGAETDDGLCAGIIISQPHSKFIKLWYESYRTFDDASWDRHAVKVPYKLWRHHPHLLHVESRSLQHPSWQKHELPYLYGKGMYYNWEHLNYAVHLWYRFYNIDHDPDSIRNLDSTVGQLFRYIYYGEKKILPASIQSRAKEIYLQF